MLEEKFETCLRCNGNGSIDEDGHRLDCDNPKCSFGEVRVELSYDDIVHVNVYAVTRHFGGHEEGGWYYNHLAPIYSTPVPNRLSENTKKELEAKYFDLKHGNIYSVLGGVDIEVLIEVTEHESETTEKPVYQ